MEVPVFEAKNRLSELLAEASRGVDVTVTKRGVPIAKIVGITPGFDREAARKAAAGLLKASQGVTLGRISIKSLIEEGRR